jgi:hypothetical protein
MEWSTRSVSRLIAIVAVVAAIACSWIPSIQDLANEQVNSGLKRAVASFAVAKTLNAAISAAQGTEVALQPLGFGLTLTLGQALDPLNDLVEQFATLMLTASIAFGVQKVLLAMGAHWAVSLGVTVVAATWAALFFYDRAPTWLSRLLVVLILVRFAVPVITIGSDWTFQAFLAKNYDEAQTSLGMVASGAEKVAVSLSGQGRNDGDKAEGKGSKATPAPGEQGRSEASPLDKLKSFFGSGADNGTAPSEGQAVDEPGWRERITQIAKQALASLDIRAKLADLRNSVDKATDHIIDLMVVFLMQTIVVPILLLWVLLKAAGGLLLRPAAQSPSGRLSSPR